MKVRKLLSGILAAAMMISMLPTAVSAAEGDAGSSTVKVSVQTANGPVEYAYDYATTAQEGYVKIGGEEVYYKASGENTLDLSSTLAARRNVTWNELYKDIANCDAGFDVITTATVNSAVDGSTWNAYSDTKDIDADGYADQTIIKGSKVPTQISAKTYVESVILAEAGKAQEGSNTAAVAELTQPATMDSGTVWAKSGLYYTLNAAGNGFSITMPKTINTVPRKAEITDSTNWGDYLVTVADEEGKHYVKTGKMDTTEYDPTSSDPEVLAGYQLGNKTMYGATFETSDGKVYTMGYLENMWSASYEFSFRIAEDTVMTGMSNSTNYGQYSDIEGKTITKMTYYGAYGVYVYDLSSFNLKVTTKQKNGITGDKEVAIDSGKDAVVKVDLSTLTSAERYGLTSVTTGSGRNSKALDAADYAYDAAAGTVTIKASALATGQYTLSFTDAAGEYATVKHAVAVTVKEEPTSIADADVSGIQDVYATGKSIVPSVTVKVGDAALEKDTDYTVDVKDNKAPGTATVTITGKGNYTGTVTKTFKIYAKKGASYTVGNYKYKVTNQNYSGKGTVTVTGQVKNSASISIPKTVKIGTAAYKVTAIGANAFKSNAKAAKVVVGANVATIGKNAFYNCKKVTSVTISTKSLTSKSVGSKAFSKLGAANYKKVTVKVPSSKLKSYKTLLVSKGLSKSAKIK